MDTGNYVSVTDLARMHGITTETLRHYDRIGLLKPAYRDETSRVRYYSLSSQDDKIGTILELRALGMSLDEIDDFFKGRNLAKSHDLLAEKHRDLAERIRQLQQLKKALSRKLASMQRALETNYEFGVVTVKRLPARWIAAGEEWRDSWGELYSDSMRFDHLLQNGSLLGEVRYIVSFDQMGVGRKGKMGILLNEREARSQSARKLEAGSFACVYRFGHSLDIDEDAELLERYCQEHGYATSGNLLEVVEIDEALTDVPEERVFELQIRIDEDLG